MPGCTQPVRVGQAIQGAPYLCTYGFSVASNVDAKRYANPGHCFEGLAVGTSISALTTPVCSGRSRPNTSPATRS